MNIVMLNLVQHLSTSAIESLKLRQSNGPLWGGGCAFPKEPLGLAQSSGRRLRVFEMAFSVVNT